MARLTAIQRQWAQIPIAERHYNVIWKRIAQRCKSVPINSLHSVYATTVCELRPSPINTDDKPQWLRDIAEELSWVNGVTLRSSKVKLFAEIVFGNLHPITVDEVTYFALLTENHCYILQTNYSSPPNYWLVSSFNWARV